MKESGNIRVAIFEDNQDLRESLAFLIDHTDGLQCTGSFPDCNNLFGCLEASLPEVILMDIEMPGMNGIEAVQVIRDKFPEIQILMQTIFQDDDAIFRAICAGASGYILKNTSPDGYVKAIFEVVQGGSPMSGPVARRVLKLFSGLASPVRTHEYNLSDREKEILEHLVQGKSYKQIADVLDISFETVRSHMKRIYNKLHVNSNTAAVRKVINEKLI
jgi:DNA-binding NarL/FixJ family response regulator